MRDVQEGAAADDGFVDVLTFVNFAAIAMRRNSPIDDLADAVEQRDACPIRWAMFEPKVPEEYRKDLPGSPGSVPDSPALP